MLAKTPHFALHARKLDVPVPVQSLGAMVPKRWAKRAVTRNAIKRQMINVSTEYAPALPVQAFVLRLRAGFNRAVFVSATSEALKLAVRSELHTLFAIATSPRAVPVAPAPPPAVTP